MVLRVFMAAVGILRIFMIVVRFYFPACTLNWVQTRTRAPMGVCLTLSPSSKNGKGRQRQTNSRAVRSGLE